MQKNNSSPFSVSITIPAYNTQHTAVSEVKKILDLIRVYNIPFEIIIVDDNSTDSTYAILKKKFGKTKNIKLIKNNTNKGIAQNIRYVYNMAKHTYILLYSIDGDWNYKDIKKLIDEAIKTHADIVIGKRSFKKGYTVKRRLVSFFYNFLPFIFFGVNPVDAGSIKIFKRKLLSQRYISKSVFYEAEIIIKATRQGKKINSIPVSYSRKKTKSGQIINSRLIFLSLVDLIQLRRSL